MFSTQNWADIEDDEPNTHVNWADIDEDDDNLQMRDGISEQRMRDPTDPTKWIVTSYSSNEQGKSTKLTKIYKEKRKKTFTNHYIEERKRTWTKAMFGKCREKCFQTEYGHNVPNPGEQMVSFELNKDKLMKSNGAEEKFWEASLSVVEQLMAEGRKKKYDATAAAAERQVKMDDAIVGGKGDSSGKGDGKGGNQYVPPSMRDGKGDFSGKGDGKGQDKSQEFTLRITNLSEETREGDVQNLFNTIDLHPMRVFLPKYKEDQVSDQSKVGCHKGFAFVSLRTKAECEIALRKLNGHGYDKLILHVQWAAPRKDA